MAKETLLSIVQSAMVASGGDPVNSIDESPESEDIASICEDVFNDVMLWDEWPHQERLASVEAVSEANNPTAMRIKDSYRFITKVQYLVDTDTDRAYYRNIVYLEPEFFIEQCDQYLNDKNSKLVQGTGLSAPLAISTDRDPQYFTTFDNEHLVFDSIDLSVETNLQESKLRTLAYVIPEFVLSDDYIIDMPEIMMPLYRAEVMIAVQYYFNQFYDKLSAKKSMRHLNKLRAHKLRVVNTQDEHYPRGQYGRYADTTNQRKLGRR